jgi:16S rRNA (guanine(1405)-N(7))-methyltransferase
MDLLGSVVAGVSSSKKYRTICPDTIRRVAARELAAAPHGNLKAAVKATKRRLHQVYGAFEQGFDLDLAYRQLQAACQAGLESDIRAACRQILAQHSSTRERLPILDRFYPAVFAVTGRPASILDLGCGLNPLASPWMGLPAGARYVALDIDAARVEFLSRSLALFGLQPLARCQDILVQPPSDPADLALLLKMSPSLERQELGATLRMLEQIQAPWIAVSFAVKSLGGREKGMTDHYRHQFQQWLAARPWPIHEFFFDTELLFLIHRGSSSRILHPARRIPNHVSRITHHASRTPDP